MTLENKKGMKKEFKVLFEVIKDEKEYLIYQDKTSEHIYAGLKNDDKLLKVDDDVFEHLNKILEKMI